MCDACNEFQRLRCGCVLALLICLPCLPASNCHACGYVLVCVRVHACPCMCVCVCARLYVQTISSLLQSNADVFDSTTCFFRWAVSFDTSQNSYSQVVNFRLCTEPCHLLRCPVSSSIGLQFLRNISYQFGCCCSALFFVSSDSLPLRICWLWCLGLVWFWFVVSVALFAISPSSFGTECISYHNQVTSLVGIWHSHLCLALAVTTLTNAH